MVYVDSIKIICTFWKHIQSTKKRRLKIDDPVGVKQYNELLPKHIERHNIQMKINLIQTKIAINNNNTPSHLVREVKKLILWLKKAARNKKRRSKSRAKETVIIETSLHCPQNWICFNNGFAKEAVFEIKCRTWKWHCDEYKSSKDVDNNGGHY